MPKISRHGCRILAAWPATLGVELPQRLVEKQQARLVAECPGEVRPLCHAIG